MPIQAIATNLPPTSTPTPILAPPETSNLAWVAGPVVGGVGGVAAIVLLGYFWRRRRQIKTAPVELGQPEERKAELHSNHLPAELNAIEEPRSPQELAGNEVAIPVRGTS